MTTTAHHRSEYDDAVLRHFRDRLDARGAVGAAATRVVERRLSAGEWFHTIGFGGYRPLDFDRNPACRPRTISRAEELICEALLEDGEQGTFSVDKNGMIFADSSVGYHNRSKPERVYVSGLSAMIDDAGASLCGDGRFHVDRLRGEARSAKSKRLIARYAIDGGPQVAASFGRDGFRGRRGGGWR